MIVIRYKGEEDRANLSKILKHTNGFTYSESVDHHEYYPLQCNELIPWRSIDRLMEYLGVNQLNVITCNEYLSEHCAKN